MKFINGAFCPSLHRLLIDRKAEAVAQSNGGPQEGGWGLKCLIGAEATYVTKFKWRSGGGGKGLSGGGGLRTHSEAACARRRASCSLAEGVLMR